MARTYGIDIHGTLACRKADKTVGPSTLFPLLSSLMAAWYGHGDHVYIISGPPKDVVQEEIASLGLVEGKHYDDIISVVDYLKKNGAEMWEDPVGSNHWWCDKGVWNAAKGRIADYLGVDILIDDEALYQAGMPDKTTFILVSASLLGGTCDSTT